MTTPLDPTHRRRARSRHALVAAISVTLIAASGVGCPDPNVPGEKAGPRSELATKWMKRAAEEYKATDLTEASDSIGKAQSGAPKDPDIRLLAGRIALARLDYEGAQKALEGLEGSEAASLRARAYWYSDDLPHTAEELTKALEDPDFKDPWAKPVRLLAGTQGAGRKPFTIKEGSARLIDVKMPRDLGYALMIPCEIDGQATIALAATGVPEVVLDAKARTNPGWVSIRFAHGDRAIEVRDVPAVVQDLSQYTGQQAVPIGALLGVNLLRRLHVTFDRRADQFILRREEPPPPSTAYAKVPVTYVRGGGMVVRGTLKKEFELPTGLWVDTGSAWPLALPDPTWKKLGVDPKSLPTWQGVAHGKITDVHIGALDLGPAEAVAGIAGLEDKLKQLDVDVAGAIGIGFLSAMRVTLADAGKTLWLETDEDTSAVLAPTVPTAGPSPSTSIAPPAPKGSATPKASATPAASTPPKATATPAASAPPKAAPMTSVAPKASAAPVAPPKGSAAPAASTPKK